MFILVLEIKSKLISSKKSNSEDDFCMKLNVKHDLNANLDHFVILQ